MDKLTLEHLAPYLPYGLMVLHTTKEESTQLIVMGMHEDGGRTRYDGEGADNDPDFSIAVCRKPHHKYRPNGYFYLQKNFKPILRPLSDLTKEIERNGERFIPIEWFEIGDDESENWFSFGHGNINLINDLNLISTHQVYHDINFLPYAVVQKLIEWHIDVLGLIDKGLAVNINTLGKEIYL